MEEKEERQAWDMLAQGDTAERVRDFGDYGTPDYRRHVERKVARKKFVAGLILGIFGSLAVVSGSLALMFGMNVIEISDRDKVRNNVMTEQVMEKLDDLIGTIGIYYYEDVDVDDLVTGIYKGLFAGLNDPYSAYYTEEEYDEMMISTTANYYGIGAGLQQDKETMQVTITKVYDDSPAQKAGLKEGDEIVEVGDIAATSTELEKLVTQIRGEEGTSVHLKINREGESDYLEYDVVRANVKIPTVESKMLEGNIGYIQVSEFAQNTPQEFETAIDSLKAEGMQAMLVDLRSNGGGLLTSCQAMLDLVLPEGTIVYTEDKYGNRQDLTSDAEHFMELPIAVLVNGNTASASEIFAGAIRDFDYGTLIGTKTFGKGIVQQVRQLADGSAYKLTVSRYFTPCGDNIHGTGIAPDIELEYEYLGDEDAEDYDEMKDNQIIKAVEELSKELK